jgi:hypothetical protein
VADLLPLLMAGELLDKWVEQWLSDERNRYHAKRMAALEVLGRGPDKQVAHYACSSVRTIHRVRSVRSPKNGSSEP